MDSYDNVHVQVNVDAQIVLNVLQDNGNSFAIAASNRDTVQKLKAKIFLQQDILPERQTLLFNSDMHSDDKTLEQIGGQGGKIENINLIVSPEPEKAVENAQPAGDQWAVVNQNHQCYVQIKDDNGQVILKQYGMIKSDRSVQYVFQDEPAPSAWQLMQEGKLIFLPDKYQVARLTLQSHPGKALVLGKKVDEYQAHDVHWAQLGPETNAIWVQVTHMPFGSFIKLDHRSNHQFDCAMGKYHENNKVPIYHAHNGGNQWFGINNDKTISPTHSPKMVWGVQNGELVLVKKDSPQQLVFKELKPSFEDEITFKLTLISHPGKGIVLNGADQQYGHGLDQYISVGDARFAMSCFMDDYCQLHYADQPFQTLDGWDHTKVAPHFFSNHLEYKHEKFMINQDGTISLNKDPSYVLGSDGSINVKWVKRGDRNQFVFEEAVEYLVKMESLKTSKKNGFIGQTAK